MLHQEAEQFRTEIIMPSQQGQSQKNKAGGRKNILKNLEGKTQMFGREMKII